MKCLQLRFLVQDEAQSKGEDPQTIANKVKGLRTVLDTIGLDWILVQFHIVYQQSWGDL